MLKQVPKALSDIASSPGLGGLGGNTIGLEGNKEDTSNEKQSEPNLKTETECGNEAMTSEIKKAEEVHKKPSNEIEDVLILPDNEPCNAISNISSIPNKNCHRQRAPMKLWPSGGNRRRTTQKTYQSKRSTEVMEIGMDNHANYTLIPSDDEIVIDALPPCAGGKDPLECPEILSHNYSLNSNNNKQIIKTATATLHISKNITVKRITSGESTNYKSPSADVHKRANGHDENEVRPDLTKRWQKHCDSALLAPTPQSNFLDAIDLRPAIATKSYNEMQCQPQSQLPSTAMPPHLLSAYQFSWLQEFIKQFVDPTLNPSQVCFLLMQRVFSYKDFHRIKTLHYDISIKGNMNNNEQHQNVEKMSLLKRAQQQLRNELRRALFHKNQLSKEGEQFWQITTSNMNAARTLSQARILITHRYTGAVTLKTHNCSPEEMASVRKDELLCPSNGHSMAGMASSSSLLGKMGPSNNRAMQSYHMGRDKGAARQAKEEAEYKPPYKIKQESLQEQSTGRDESTVKRSLRVRTKRHYDDNFTYDDEILMNYWGDAFEDISMRDKRNLSKFRKAVWKGNQQQPPPQQPYPDRPPVALSLMGNDVNMPTRTTTTIKKEIAKMQSIGAVSNNGISPPGHLNVLSHEETSFRDQRLTRVRYNNQWPLNTDRSIHTNCVSKDVCVICKMAVSCMVQHYVNVHRGAEVYISRLTEEQLQYLRNNNRRENKAGNVATLNVYKNGQLQYETMCIFCLKTSRFMLNYWYQHFTIHTGEYAYRCLDCGVRKPTRYLLSQYHDQERRDRSSCRGGDGDMHSSHTSNDVRADCYYHSATVVQDYNFDSKAKEIVAYLCTLCNYIQLQRKNIMKHLYTQHQIKCILPQHTEKLILLRIPEEVQVINAKRRAGTVGGRTKILEPWPGSQMASTAHPPLTSTMAQRRSLTTAGSGTENSTIATISLDDSSDSSCGSPRPVMQPTAPIQDISVQEERDDPYIDQCGTDYGDDLSYMICGMLDVEIITK